MIREVTPFMKDKFIGGKGYGLYLLWRSVTPQTRWDSPENGICISSGPLGGTPIYPGSGKSIVVSVSPLTDQVVDSNVGGYFGPYLKFSGFDAIEVNGIAESPVIVIIDGVEGKVRVEKAPKEMGKGSYEVTKYCHERFGYGDLRSISVISTGPASEHTKMGLLNFSWYDIARKRCRIKQAGRGGIGTVLWRKGLKAIVVRSPKVSIESNGPSDPEALRAVSKNHTSEVIELDPKQNEMAKVGTAHLPTIMDDYDLLPTNNYKFGSVKDIGGDAQDIGREAYRKRFDPGFDGCWMGCTVACAHGVRDFVLSTGPKKGQRVFVDGPEYETIAGVGSNCGIVDADHIIEMNYYCDDYGLDTISVGTATAFAMECFENGLINKDHTGGLDLRFGNKGAALELVHQMAKGKGFGVLVGQGIREMKRTFRERFGSDPSFMEDIGMESKGLEFSEYMTKESLAQQGGYGLTLKGPQHDEAWLIFLDMVHNFMPTFEQKAEALHWFPMFRTWFGLCGLCKLPWNDIVPLDNKQTKEPAKVMKHVQWYSDYFTAVTGRKVDPDGIIAMSEVVYNFQRIFNIRMGKGKREHDTIPYRAMGPVTEEEYHSRKDRYDGQLKQSLGLVPESMSVRERMAALRKYREERYESLKDAVYSRRGWTKNGVPTMEKVKALGLDIPEVVEIVQKNQ
jgi:aldehyde:ferredoxin oxidoreductase